MSVIFLDAGTGTMTQKGIISSSQIFRLYKFRPFVDCRPNFWSIFPVT